MLDQLDDNDTQQQTPDVAPTADKESLDEIAQDFKDNKVKTEESSAAANDANQQKD